MTAPTQAQIEAAAEAIHSQYSWDVSKNDSYWKQLAKAALTAAAESGEPSKIELEMGDLAHQLFLETIERCAQAVDEIAAKYRGTMAVEAVAALVEAVAAIRAMKEQVDGASGPSPRT